MLSSTLVQLQPYLDQQEQILLHQSLKQFQSLQHPLEINYELTLWMKLNHSSTVAQSARINTYERNFSYVKINFMFNPSRASWCTTTATAEETPLSMQKLWSGDRQSEMVGNRAEKYPNWRTVMAKPEVSRKE